TTDGETLQDDAQVEDDAAGAAEVHVDAAGRRVHRPPDPGAGVRAGGVREEVAAVRRGACLRVPVRAQVEHDLETIQVGRHHLIRLRPLYRVRHIEVGREVL